MGGSHPSSSLVASFDEFQESIQKTPFHWAPRRDLLRFLRESKLRRSDLALLHGTFLLEHFHPKLGDELWTVHEQVFLAALDLYQLEIANKHLEKLNETFPKSLRVKRLKGLNFEAREKWDEAEAIYQEILQNDPSDCLAIKRRVCILKAQGKFGKAIELLNKYLEDFMMDESAWGELADIYQSLQLYKQASFCCEELILSSPYSFYYHERYAGLMYSQSHHRLARSYFAHAIELNPNSARSLIGLYLSVLKSISGKERNSNDTKLISFANQKLLQLYSEKNPTLLKIVEKTLRKLSQ